MTPKKGNARRIGIDDNVNTDYIISGRYKFQIEDHKELAKHIFEDVSPNFYGKVKSGDFLVAGENFGCGSSREQAPVALMSAGISAVVAKSFARIFYRNSFNIGLCLLECDTDGIKDGNRLEIDLKKGYIKNLSRGKTIPIRPMPAVMSKLLADGGVIKHFKKHKGFKIK